MQHELLVGLAAGEDAHVRQRRRGQQAAQQVERLRLDRAPVRRLGLAVAAREAVRRPRLDHRQAARVGVEQAVHRALVLGPELGMAPVAVAAARHRGVVGDVARGLLEVGGEPRALEDLRERRSRPTRRRRGRRRAAPPSRRRSRGRSARRAGPRARPRPRAARRRRDVARELVEVEPPQRALVARVAGEQRALDRLRQAHEREDGPVEVREMGGEAGSLLLAERLDRILHGASSLGGGSEGTPSAGGSRRNPMQLWTHESVSHAAGRAYRIALRADREVAADELGRAGSPTATS